MFGDAFDKGLTFKMGQTHVQRFLPELLEHIELGHLNPEAIVTHRLSLEQAARGYELFDKGEENCRKVILMPGIDDRPLVEPLEEELTPEFRVQGVPGF
jgi:threonine dehydrogenase-like Zn-dependent dehydrogenase